MPFTYQTTKAAVNYPNGTEATTNFYSTGTTFYSTNRTNSTQGITSYGTTAWGETITSYNGWNGNNYYTQNQTSSGSNSAAGSAGGSAGTSYSVAGTTYVGITSSAQTTSSNNSTHTQTNSTYSTWSINTVFQTTYTVNSTISNFQSSSMATSTTIQVATSNGTTTSSTTCSIPVGDSGYYVTYNTTIYSTSTYNTTLKEDIISGLVVSALSGRCTSMYVTDLYVNEILASINSPSYPIKPSNYYTASVFTFWQTDTIGLINGSYVTGIENLITQDQPTTYTFYNQDSSLTSNISTNTITYSTITVTTVNSDGLAQFPQLTTTINTNVCTTSTIDVTLGFINGTNSYLAAGIFNTYNVTLTTLTTFSGFASSSNAIGGITFQQIGQTTIQSTAVSEAPAYYSGDTAGTVAINYTSATIGNAIAIAGISALWDYQAYPQPINAWQLPGSFKVTDQEYLVVYPVGTTINLTANEVRPGVSVPAAGNFSFSYSSTTWNGIISTGPLSLSWTQKTGTSSLSDSSTYSWQGSGQAQSIYSTFVTTFDGKSCGWIGHSSQPIIIGLGQTEITYNGTDSITATEFFAAFTQSSQTDNATEIGLAREWSSQLLFADSSCNIAGIYPQGALYQVFQRNKLTTNLKFN